MRNRDDPPAGVALNAAVRDAPRLAYGPDQFDTPRARIHVDLRVGGRYELTIAQHGSGTAYSG